MCWVCSPFKILPPRFHETTPGEDETNVELGAPRWTALSWTALRRTASAIFFKVPLLRGTVLLSLPDPLPRETRPRSPAGPLELLLWSPSGDPCREITTRTHEQKSQHTKQKGITKRETQIENIDEKTIPHLIVQPWCPLIFQLRSPHPP